MHDKQSFSELAALINQPYVYLDICNVNDHVVSVMRIEGQYPMHRHTKDEMYIILEGEITVNFKKDKPLTLKKGESTVVKAYTEHYTASDAPAMALVFKAKDYSVSPVPVE